MRSLLACIAALSLSTATLAFSVKDSNAEQRWLRVHNRTSTDLCYVYISNVGTGDWGPDILGSSCLSPGRYRTVDPGWQQGYCKMDMQFVLDDDTEIEEWNYNICVEEDYYVYR